MGFYGEGHKKHVGADGFFFKLYLNCNIPHCICFTFLNLFFLKKNAYRKAEEVREERDDDLNKLLQFFRECKDNDEHFYWDVDADPKTGVVRNIFWSHASQRAEYRDFGDVITFDTTHKTNSRHMPLAMFVGANNNLKNVTFGQALIGDE